MSLPYSDPANPALPSPLFSDLAAARSDHLRANNNAIFTDLTYLNDLIAAATDVYSIDVSGGTASITIPDDALYYATIRLYGAPTVNKTLVFPTQVRSYRIINNCTGAYYSLINYYSLIKTASGTGVYSAPGDIWDVYCDGTNIKPIRLLAASATLTMVDLSFAYSSGIIDIPISSGAFENNTLAEISGNAFIPKNNGLINITAYLVPSVAQSYARLVVRKEDGDILVYGDYNVANSATTSLRAAISATFRAVAGSSYTLAVSMSSADASAKLINFRITKL